MQVPVPQENRTPTLEFDLPLGVMAGWAVVLAAAWGVAGWLIVPLVRHGEKVGLGSLVGAAAGAGGVLVGAAVIRPWKKRRAGTWGVHLLAGQGVGFFAVLILDVLIYSTTRPEPVALALVSAGTFSSAMVAQARVFAARARSVGGTQATPGARDDA